MNLFEMRQCSFFLRIRYMVKKLNYRLYIRKLLVLFVKLAKNVDPDKYGYSGYGIAFDLICVHYFHGHTLPAVKGLLFIIISANMSSSVMIIIKRKTLVKVQHKA